MRSKWLFILGLPILTANSFGQSKDSIQTDTTILIDPVILPSFPGGQAALTEYVNKNLHWPQGQLTVEGRVFVEFSVDVDGKIRDARVIKGLCDACDKEALRLVNSMPGWIPGRENGRTVKTKMVLPVKLGL